MTPDDRKKFYTSQEEEDDVEYELEPIDPAILAAEKRRAQEVLEETKVYIDLDEIYRDASQQNADEIVRNWLQGLRKNFRFSWKHLLIALAILGIIVTLAWLDRLAPAIVVGTMVAVGGIYLYFHWHEQKVEEEATARREALYAKRKAYFEGKNRGSGDTAQDDDAR